MDNPLQQLTSFSCGTTYEDIPVEVMERVSGIVVDSLGCLVGGQACRAVDVGRKVAADDPSGSCWGAVVGMEGAVPVEMAAFLNTAMIRFLSFNDHLVAGHASDIIGALLAVSQRPGRRVTGKQLLTSVAVAYEVHARVVELTRRNNTIDRTYSITIGATAALCNLLGLSQAATAEAISMAVTTGPMLRVSRAGELSDFKGAAAAFATKSAVFCVLVAEQGLTGPSAPFEGRHGLRELFEGEQGEVQMEPFGDWKLLDTCTKYWPVAYGIQPAIWTAVEIRDQISADQIEKVLLSAAPFGWFECGSEEQRWDPRSRETADHSMPYAWARTIKVGGVDLGAFEEEAYRDPETLALMQRITVEPDWTRGPKVSDIVGVRAEVTTTSGKVIVVNVDAPRGHRTNPMSREDIDAKASRLMEPVLGAGTQAALAAAWDLNDAPNLDALFEAFTP